MAISELLSWLHHTSRKETGILESVPSDQKCTLY